jgi:hypothetical protein
MSSASLLNNPEHWRKRAGEARRVAEELNDAEQRKTMFEIAEAYDRIAERAEQVEKQSKQG